MDKCPKCGHEEQAYFSPPMSQEDRDIMKKVNPVGYTMMMLREGELRNQVIEDRNRLLDYMNQHDPAGS